VQLSADSFKNLIRLSDSLIPLLTAAVVVPFVVLIGFGVLALFKFGYMLYFVGLLAVSALAGGLSIWLIKRKAGHASIHLQDEAMVKASPDWSEFDLKAWDEAGMHISALLKQDSQWSAMQSHALDVVSFIAGRYHESNARKELAFSAVELLKMTEEISRRYRRTLMNNVPYVERLKVSTLKMFYDQRTKVSLAGKFYNLYRAYRVFTPWGLLAEARGLLLGKLFSGLNMELQSRLKEAFLQEVASAAIDLYSGRFRIDDEPALERAAARDRKLMASAPDPLRVCLAGQVSAGKSAIINALTRSMAAEINMLPSTDKVSIYKCGIEGLDIIHLVDLPGLDGKESNNRLILNEVTAGDVVLWVLKANQSARSLDLNFMKQLDDFYAKVENRSRKRPVLIGILSQVDRLKPVKHWNPPYTLDSPDSEKAGTIKQALEHNKAYFCFDEWMPLSVSADKEHYNLSQLKSVLRLKYDAALQTQLNRRRLQGGEGLQLDELYRRAGNAASALFQHLTEDKK